MKIQGTSLWRWGIFHRQCLVVSKTFPRMNKAANRSRLLQEVLSNISKGGSAECSPGNTPLRSIILTQSGLDGRGAEERDNPKDRQASAKNPVTVRDRANRDCWV